MFSRDGTLLPAICADARYIDAVIVSRPLLAYCRRHQKCMERISRGWCVSDSLQYALHYTLHSTVCTVRVIQYVGCLGTVRVIQYVGAFLCCCVVQASHQRPAPAPARLNAWCCSALLPLTQAHATHVPHATQGCTTLTRHIRSRTSTDTPCREDTRSWTKW